MLLLNAGQEAGHVFEGNERNIETIAEPDETRGFYRRVDIENAGQERRLICNDTNRAPIEPRKAYANVWRVVLLHFEKVTVIDDLVDNFAYVVRLVGS